MPRGSICWRRWRKTRPWCSLRENTRWFRPRSTIALPPGYEAQVRPRSGLAAKHGITVLNSPGTIDADYRGEIGVLLINHGDAPFPIRRGERIAQMVIAAVVMAELVPALVLSTTDRGAGGFGSTGR